MSTEYPSMKEGAEGIFALKALEGGQWKWNRVMPGNGTSRAFLSVCNSHTDCAAGAGKQMRCVLQDGRFIIQHKGEHHMGKRSAWSAGQKRVLTFL